MKKVISFSLIILALVAYVLVHTDNLYKDRIVAYREWLQLTQDIGWSNTVDYTLLASGLQNIVAISPSRYKPYEFAALFASTLNKLNPSISTNNVNTLISIATQWLSKDCDPVVLQQVLDASIGSLSWLDIPSIICKHKQLPSLLALVYSTYKTDPDYAKKLYFLAQHASDQ